MVTPLFFTVAEAAERLKLRELGHPEPEKTLRRWAAKGRVPHSHVGKAVVFTEEDLRGIITKDSDSQRLLGMQPARQADKLEPGQRRQGQYRAGAGGTTEPPPHAPAPRIDRAYRANARRIVPTKGG